jgi:hypothetical protein
MPTSQEALQGFESELTPPHFEWWVECLHRNRNVTLHYRRVGEALARHFTTTVEWFSIGLAQLAEEAGVGEATAKRAMAVLNATAVCRNGPER